MNILFLCNKSPYPAREGGPIAIEMMIEGAIRAGHTVKVLGVNSDKYFVDIASIPEEYKAKTRIELIHLDLQVRLLPAFINLFTSRSLNIERFISSVFRNRLIQILQEEKFDIVQFEMLHMSPYLDAVKEYSNARTILRAHNIEHLIWERIRKNTINPVKRFYLGHLSRTLKKYEVSVIPKFDGIVAITEKDAQFFRRVVSGNKFAGTADHVHDLPGSSNIGTSRVITIPFGIELSRYPKSTHDFEFPSLFSIGSMDWDPNIEGITWFLEKVWPDVHRRLPTLKFYIAGRHMPDWLSKKNYPQVVVVGEVEDALKFMQSKGIMIVPLLSGSGIRIKIIEGMAAGKTIISTTIGAEGIHYTNGTNILVSDTPAAFVDAITKVAGDRNLCTEIGKNARNLVETEYQQKDLIVKLLGFYEKSGS